MMASLGSPYRDKTITDPESLTDKELRKISLSSLSKNLPQTTSSRSTITVYLRWLEIHRVAETRLTEHWPNTLLHWSQSLRSRGFRESELVSEVRKWKKANPDLKLIRRREPPSSFDIAKAFEGEAAYVRNKDRERENRRLRERDLNRKEGDSYRPLERSHNEKHEQRHHHLKSTSHQAKYLLDKFDQPPPSNYICNRCGKKGHHLQVCPTNMDPSYDVPPDDNYVCCICDARGEHFKSLCPRNKDPYSIIQRRRDRGIEATPPKNGANFLSDWERDIQKQKSADRLEERGCEQGRLSRPSESASGSSRNSLTPSRTTSTMEKLQEIEEMKMRLYREESVEMTEILTMTSTPGSAEKDRKRGQTQELYKDSERIFNAASPLPEVQGQRKRIRTDNRERDRRSLEPELGSDQIYSIFNDGRQALTDENTMGQGGQGYEIDTEMTDDANTDAGEQGEIVKMDETPIPESLSIALRPSDESPDSMITTETDGANSSTFDEMDIDGLIPPPPHVKTYHEDIMKLIQSRREMSEIVHTIHRRSTALDMWNGDDHHRKARRRARTPDQPREPTALESTQGNGCDRSSSEESVYYEVEGFSQFDGTSDAKGTKPSPQKETNAMGREGAEKMKELTANVVKGLPHFMPRGCSPHRESGKLVDGDQVEITSGQSDVSVDSMHVNAASSTLKLTKANIENLVSDIAMKPRASRDSFGSFEVTLPGNRMTVQKNEHVATTASQRTILDPGHLASGQTQSSRGIRVAMQQANLDDLKQFAGTLKLSTPVPADILSLMTNDPEKQRNIRNKSLVNVIEVATNETRLRTSSVATPVTENSTGTNMQVDTARSVRGGKGLRSHKAKYSKDDMKKFAEGLKLKTPAPEDLPELFKKGEK